MNKRAVVACLLLLILFYSSAAVAAETTIIYYEDVYGSSFADALRFSADGIELKPAERPFQYYLKNGGATEAFINQVMPAKAVGDIPYWYPQYTATVVIAVDREQTQAKIKGWRSLQNINVSVGFLENRNFPKMIFGAMSYALEPGSYSSKEAINLLNQLAKRNQLVLNEENAAVLLCLDYQAVALKKQGRNLDIIIPEEGSVSYLAGVASNRPLPFLETMEETLLGAGFRLPDGRVGNAAYPTADAYERVHPLSNSAEIEAFNRSTWRFIKVLRREILNVRLNSSADGVQHNVYAGIIILLTTVWTIVSRRRILNQSVRQAILRTGLLVIFYIFLRYLKYQTPNHLYWIDVNRYIWYGYYIFILAMPFTLFWLASAIDIKGRYVRPWHLKVFFPILYIAMLIAIFTNDYHQCVFVFDDIILTQQAYHYGPLYYVITVVGLVLFLLAISLLLKLALDEPQKDGFLITLALVIPGLIYFFLFSARIDIAYPSDFVLISGIWVLSYFEGAMQSNLVPVNSKYRILFMASPLQMQIVDLTGKSQLLSASEKPISESLWRHLKNRQFEPIAIKEDTLLHANPIAGGAVLWKENISEIRALQKEIQEHVNRIQAVNAILSKQRENKAELVLFEEKMSLLASLSEDIKNKTERLQVLIQELPQAKDRRLAIGRIATLMCYIKRRCNLFFGEQEGEILQSIDLTVYFDELAEFANYAGVRIVVRCNINENLSPAQATVLYDFYYVIIAACSRISNTSIVAQLISDEEGILLRLLPSVSLVAEDFLDEQLAARIKALNAIMEIKALDDSLGITLRLFKGGEADA